MEKIIHVNPCEVTHYVGANDLRFPFNLPYLDWVGAKLPILRHNRYYIPARHYRKPIRIEKLDKYKKVKDYLECDHYSQSKWYEDLIDELEKNGVAKHKRRLMRSQQEIELFFEQYINPMIDSLCSKGYRKGESIGSVTIGEDGEIHKANAADHRFFIARILRIQPIPVKIRGVHHRYALIKKTTQILKESYRYNKSQ